MISTLSSRGRLALLASVLLIVEGVAAAPPPGCLEAAAPFGRPVQGQSPEEMDSAVRAWIESTGFQGILLTAPERVVGEESLHLDGWYVRSLREDLHTRFEQEAILVAADLERGAAFVASAFPAAKQPPAKDVPPDYDPGPGVAISRFTVDARGALGRALPAGRYVLAVMYRESNTRTTFVTIETAGEPAGETADSRASAQATTWPVRFRPAVAERAPHEGVGVTLEAGPDRLLATGKYRLPISAGKHVLIVLWRPHAHSFELLELPEDRDLPATGQRAGAFELQLAKDPPAPGSWLHAMAPCGDVKSVAWFLAPVP